MLGWVFLDVFSCQTCSGDSWQLDVWVKGSPNVLLRLTMDPVMCNTGLPLALQTWQDESFSMQIKYLIKKMRCSSLPYIYCKYGLTKNHIHVTTCILFQNVHFIVNNSTKTKVCIYNSTMASWSVHLWFHCWPDYLKSIKKHENRGCLSTAFILPGNHPKASLRCPFWRCWEIGNVDMLKREWNVISLLQIGKLATRHFNQIDRSMVPSNIKCLMIRQSALQNCVSDVWRSIFIPWLLLVYNKPGCVRMSPTYRVPQNPPCYSARFYRSPERKRKKTSHV